MADFRDALYDRYVTAFKGRESLLEGRDLESYWAWCDTHLAPLLSEVDKQGHLLELGSGPGYLLEYLRRRGFVLAEGVDKSEEQVRIALGRGVNAQVADALDVLQAFDHELSAVIAIDFVEHFSTEELMELLASIRKSLAPNGVLLLQTPNGAGLAAGQIVYGDLSHFTILTPSSLEQALRISGFEHITIRETGPERVTAKGRLRWRLWRVVRWAANWSLRVQTGKVQDVWTQTMVCACLPSHGPTKD